ncbi:MAG TPA: MerR family transcriptional regulator [Fimbriimonas sp.]
MGRLETYGKLAPFTIDELVEAANSVLRDNPRLQVAKRTVRYYIAEGIVPPPTGAPKYARYPFESLLRIVGARSLLDQGVPLERSREMLDRLLKERGSQAVSQVEEWLTRQENPPPPAMFAEASAPLHLPPSPRLSSPPQIDPRRSGSRESAVRRIELSEGLVLEADASRSTKEALIEALAKIQKILGLSPHTT